MEGNRGQGQRSCGTWRQSSTSCANSCPALVERMSREHAARWRVEVGGDMAAAAHQEMVLVCIRSRWRQAGVVRDDRLLKRSAAFLFMMLQCIIKGMIMLLLLLLLLYVLLLIHEKLHAHKIVSPDIRVHRL